jgi:hypothetical protein
MFIKSFFAGLGAIAFAACAHAAPITITQTFTDVSFTDYQQGGVTEGKVIAGDWIFTGTVDSEAANISSWPDIGAYQLTRLTLTQASLGLFDVGIVNAPVLFFYPDRFGFASNVSTAPPWTVIVYEAGHFSKAHTLAEYLSLSFTPSVTDSYTGFGPQWTGFELEDGRRIHGWGHGTGITNLPAVPEPAGLALVFAGLGAVACLKARRP